MTDAEANLLVDHFQNPRNRGTLEHADVDCEDVNAGCGDRVRLQATVDEDDTITSIRFVGDGCVLSMASASILTTLVEGASLRDVVLRSDEHMLDALKTTVSPRRYDCALLAHRTLKSGLVRLAHERRLGRT